MDKNILGTSNTILPTIFMHIDLLCNVTICSNQNDPCWIIHLFRNLLEFLSLRIQMHTRLQDNIVKLLRSFTYLRNIWFNMLDRRTWNV